MALALEGVSWQQWLMNALPILLLVGFWLVVMGAMRREKGKQSEWKDLQERHTRAIEEQTETLQKTNELLKKLLEKR